MTHCLVRPLYYAWLARDSLGKGDLIPSNGVPNTNNHISSFNPTTAKINANTIKKVGEEKWQVSNQLSPKKCNEEEGKDMSVIVESKAANLMSPVKNAKPKDGLGNPNGKLNCKHCAFKTDFNWYLRKHMLAKHEDCKEYEFSCSKCNFKTNFKWNLKKHWSNKHEDCESVPLSITSKGSPSEPTTSHCKVASLVVRSSPEQEGNRKYKKKKASQKKVKKQRGLRLSDFSDRKLAEVPEVNPYSRQLSSRRGEGVRGTRSGERDVAEESKRNRAECLTEPYCRICQLLLEPGDRQLTPCSPQSQPHAHLTCPSPEVRLGLASAGAGLAANLPRQSAVWVPSRGEAREEARGEARVEVEGEAREEVEGEEELPVSHLVVCSSCHLCVHRACYLLNEEKVEEEWVCQACSIPPSSTCSLCCGGGGDLQRTTRGRLAHLSCALLLPETRVAGGMVDLGSVPSRRRTIECLLCGGAELSPAVHCQVRRVGWWLNR